MVEKRKLVPEKAPRVLKTGTDLPLDFVKMVTEVFENNFASGLKALSKIQKGARFGISGNIFHDEILLSVSLLFDDPMVSTTFHASCDFDPRASAPKADELLAVCVDAAGGFFGEYLLDGNETKLPALAAPSLSDFEDGPFDWTQFTVNKRNVYVKLDKSNPLLERETEKWLDKNDPERAQRGEQEHAITEEKFITGKKRRED